ncbi:transposase [Actinomadura bangladeshensis]|uniref:transposase n=1 Tax=Actinomadura bangladeshensis TaxID=453573 RepID=UPI001FB779E1|nr:transposase [Actinomadura bangladeshensis]
MALPPAGRVHRRQGTPSRRAVHRGKSAYTSQRCPRCGHTARNNRPARDHFCCRRCGLAGPADVVAGVNVRDRARSAWVFVNMPEPVPAWPRLVDATRNRPAVAGSREREQRPKDRKARSSSGPSS